MSTVTTEIFLAHSLQPLLNHSLQSLLKHCKAPKATVNSVTNQIPNQGSAAIV